MTATVARAQNGGSCRDATAISGAQLEARVERSGRLRLSLHPSTGATDPLRTRCSGPDLGRHSLATATVPRGVWRRRTFAVSLQGTGFGDGPYRVAIDSTMRLGLHRRRVTSKVYEIPEPVPGAQAR